VITVADRLTEKEVKRAERILGARIHGWKGPAVYIMHADERGRHGPYLPEEIRLRVACKAIQDELTPVLKAAADVMLVVTNTLQKFSAKLVEAEQENSDELG
jgi:hypothetical protein